ncbi:MAG: hypothetical protein K5770_03440 [Lachnospiraceae bacterium]|nr:hypothetical protein [Lachnospiraceae bacterium]
MEINGQNNMDRSASISDGQWEAIGRLIPLLGRQNEWEISRNRHHELCLWEREEDAPFIKEEAVKALKGAMTKPLWEYPLSDEDIDMLSELL